MNLFRPLAHGDVPEKIPLLLALLLAAVLFAGCQVAHTAAFDEGRFDLEGPSSIKNQADYATPDGHVSRLNTDGYPYHIDYGADYGLVLQGNGPSRFVGATLPGGVTFTIASETDYGWDSATGGFDPESGNFTFRIDGFKSDASSVAQQVAAALAIRVPGWQTMAETERDALVKSTETIVAGGVAIAEAAGSVAETFMSGGAAAIVPD